MNEKSHVMMMSTELFLAVISLAQLGVSFGQSERSSLPAAEDPTFCKTQVLKGNLTMFKSGLPIYELPLIWVQDNEKQILKIRVDGVADYILNRENKFLRKNTGDKYVCTITDGMYSDLCTLYHFISLGNKKNKTMIPPIANSRSFQAHRLPLSMDMLLPSVQMWEVAFNEDDGRITGLLGVINGDMHYTFMPTRTKKPASIDLGIPEECLMLTSS